jgi:hypothetical protein
MIPKEHRDITTTLPLLPGCRAVLWDGAVALYDARGQCIAYEGLDPGEQATAAWMVRRIGVGQWKLVSDWRPA